MYLENWVAYLFNDGCKSFTDDDYTAAGLIPLQSNVCGLAGENANNSLTIGAVIDSNGGAQIPPCTYSFPEWETPQQFLTYALYAESVTVGYYLEVPPVSCHRLEHLRICKLTKP
jgi:hypothetical protein